MMYLVYTVSILYFNHTMQFMDETVYGINATIPLAQSFELTLLGKEHQSGQAVL